MTRAGMLLWSAVTGLLIGLTAGIGLLAALTLLSAVVPGLSARAIDRLRVPALVILLGLVPLVAAVLGYLEGRAKLP